MPKFFDDPEIRLWRINENRWFEIHQDLLLWMANTKAGRDLLCIPQDYGPIFLFKKNCVHFLHDKALRADFRIGAKWANVIRYRWQEFNALARYFPVRHLPFASPLTRTALSLSAATLTAYPDPSPETSTFDGWVQAGDFSTWDLAHDDTDGVPTATLNDSATTFRAGSQQNSGPIFYISRAFTLFDTSSLTSGATISAADMKMTSSGKQDSDNDAQAYITFVGLTTPASNTAIAADDYDQCGSINSPTKFTDDYDISSFTTNVEATWTVNATGLTNISKTGITKWGYREGHDIEDISVIQTADNGSEGRFYSADQTGTSQDPNLVVTYTTATSTIYLPILGVG